MSKNFSLNQLTEGIRQRHLGLANRRLVEKWSRTGLLRGLDGVNRENMAMLMENQASQLLREANSLGAGGGDTSNGNGDIRGFTNIAFPIVRRVFGGLVANDLVSIQPMSLPSGLLFYLDYAYGGDAGGAASAVDRTADAGDVGAANTSVYTEGDSIYNSPNGSGVAAGSDGLGGQYDLAGSGFSKVHTIINAGTTGGVTIVAGEHGAFDNDGENWGGANELFTLDGGVNVVSDANRSLIQWDPALMAVLQDLAATGNYRVVTLPVASLTGCDLSMVKDIAVLAGGSGTHQAVSDSSAQAGGSGVCNIRRLNRRGDMSSGTFTSNPTSGSHILTICDTSGTTVDTGTVAVSYVTQPERHGGDSGDSLVVPAFESDFDPAGPAPAIPEIDIKIESVAVTAATRKLRARWSPELAQDLNAYHSLDAEVELTQILSEQVALEIDREILNDLLTQASGANLFWSRAPGQFVVKDTGLTATVVGGNLPSFTGTVREWYETLVETIIDCANTIHRKTLRGSANFIVVGPDVATILEASVLYRPSYSLDGDGQVGAPFTLGCEKAGTLSNRFTVYKDPYFPRNKILVGYKGGSYLETGYVYAPYVPLIVTPTIFAPEDFTPRKGVMTRYGKKMVRADFYGTVTVMDLNVI